MICAYCGKEAKSTREHIISNGILGLFPECYITFDGERDVVHENDPMIKDVCEDCNNNKITYIDSYAKGIIEKYFLRKYVCDEQLEFEYDYTLIQKMCLKFAFNDLRSRKKDISFFDDEIKNYLMNSELSEPLRNVTVIAGLAVNTTPMPDYMFGNMKLRWSDNPIFLSNSLVRHLDYETGQIFIREDNKSENFNKYLFSYIFRFNSLQIIILCWDKNISDEELFQNNVVIEHQYPYAVLDREGKKTLSRCTSEATYHNEKIIDVSWGQSMMDEISYMRGAFSEEAQKYFESVDKAWKTEEQRIAEEHPRK